MRREIFVAARITRLEDVDPGEIRKVELTLPKSLEIEGLEYPIKDRMRPGTAFLARPFGTRTQRQRRRLYSRSNSPMGSEGTLQTFINHTHAVKADTSIWWQGPSPLDLYQRQGTLPVGLYFDPELPDLTILQNSHEGEATNLYLESDKEWPQMRYVALAFSTGITPFLSYLHFMHELDFGRSDQDPGCHFTLITSVRHKGQLMEDDWLNALEEEFPKNFRYHPVLTRSWPEDWPYTSGRVIRKLTSQKGKDLIDLSPLLEIIPDLENTHLRLCGSAETRSQLELGLNQNQVKPLSLRMEAW